MYERHSILVVIKKMQIKTTTEIALRMLQITKNFKFL